MVAADADGETVTIVVAVGANDAVSTGVNSPLEEVQYESTADSIAYGTAMLIGVDLKPVNPMYKWAAPGVIYSQLLFSIAYKRV